MTGDSDNGAPQKGAREKGAREKGAREKGAEVREFRAAGRGKKCPICAAPVVTAFRPFCSKRCADLDLGRWLREDYRLPSEEPADGDEGDEREDGPEPPA